MATGIVLPIPIEFEVFRPGFTYFKLNPCLVAVQFYNCWYSTEATATVDSVEPYWISKLIDKLGVRYDSDTIKFLWGLLVLNHVSLGEYFHRITDWTYTGSLRAIATTATHFTIVYEGV